MLALVADPSPRLVRDHPTPIPSEGEALLRLRVAGVCDTDIQITRGYLHHHGVLGHEMVADVLRASNEALVGRRVVADINAGCGSCEDCVTRDGHHCRSRTVVGIAGRDGAFAEYMVVPERNLVVVPENVFDEAAVFAEPLAAAAHAIDEVDAGASVVVLGDGKLGLLTALCLCASGRRPILVGHHDENLSIAARVGSQVINAREREVRELTGADAVIEATGSAAGLRAALELVRPRGTIILKTTVAARFQIDLAPIVIHEIRVVGSRCGNLRRAIDWLDRGRVDPTPLIRWRFGLEKAVEALAKAAEPAALKVLITNDV